MFRNRLAILAASLGLIAVACAGNDDGGDNGNVENGPADTATDTATPVTSEPTPEATNTPVSEDSPKIRALFGQWPNTDPATLTVDPDEILRGCPGKDCIPALDVVDAVTIRNPAGGVAKFEPVAEADFEDQMPISYITVNGQTRGYPLHILTWHEIVNDLVGGVPVAVTFCPLCNTALSFERTVDGVVLDFGVSGMLRFSDLVMFDRQTESWWQQAVGEAFVGEYAGTVLKPVTTSVVSFGDFKASFPDADILSTDTGLARSYGFNPYVGYDTSTRPFLFRGETDDRLQALERIVSLDINDEQLAVPFSELAEVSVANVTVGGTAVVVFWELGTVTALGGDYIPEASDVGAAVAYSAVVDGEVLEFRRTDEETFTDSVTGTVWSITGIALEGPMAGRRLEPIPHTVQFWFSWGAFFPETEIWEAA